MTGSKKRDLTVLEGEDQDDREEFKVTGLIDADDSEVESEDEKSNKGKTNEKSDDVSRSDNESLTGSDSDAELNKLLAAEEEGSDSDSLEEVSDEDGDSKSMKDKLTDMGLRTLSDDTLNRLGEKKSRWADGTVRILHPEIDPVYDSDDSDREETNTVGNIPLSAYEEYPHIGYDINGKRIMRPAKGSALEQLLENVDLPAGWTGLLDKESGKALNLTEDELKLIRDIGKNENVGGEGDENPYETTLQWFTNKTEVMPLSAAPEPKGRFIPSKNEAKRVMKLVKAIREGRIVPPSEKTEEEKQRDEEEQMNYDIWGDENDKKSEDHVMNMPAPKLPPPTNEMSYNPPEEYLPTAEEEKEWKDTDPNRRHGRILPHRYTALRKVPGYVGSIRERFDRCLDLYLAPRMRKNKLNVDPESLIPKLPSPKDLRPFPVRVSITYEGHQGRIRTLDIDPSGNWLATGSDDGTVRIWEVETGRSVFTARFVNNPEESEDHIECVSWNPRKDVRILAVCCGASIYLIVPSIFGYEVENASRTAIESGWGYAKQQEQQQKQKDNKAEVSQWIKPTSSEQARDICCVINTSRGSGHATKTSAIKKVSWHRRGDYFVTVSPEGANKASVLIHQLSHHSSQSPFRKSRGIVMDAQFHPTRPQLIVMSQRYIRIYDLQQQKLMKKLLPGAKWLSCMDIHPKGGDHIIAGSYDKRLMWHDLDLGNTPYKTLRYQDKAIRSVAFHKGELPLFCSASDDGTIDVFHATVYDDMMTNPLLVPLKRLKGHKIVDSLGVLSVCWHPKEAWLFSAGADGTAKLWTE